MITKCKKKYQETKKNHLSLVKGYIFFVSL